MSPHCRHIIKLNCWPFSEFDSTVAARPKLKMKSRIDINERRRKPMRGTTLANIMYEERMPEEEAKISLGPLNEYIARPFEIGAMILNFIGNKKKKTKPHQYCIHLLAKRKEHTLSGANDIDSEQRENRQIDQMNCNLLIPRRKITYRKWKRKDNNNNNKIANNFSCFFIYIFAACKLRCRK